MHQNKFHTETIQRLTAKCEACSNGGPTLNAEEQKLADHLKILYKFANKGIKGRGKKETRSTLSIPIPQKVSQTEQQHREVPDQRPPESEGQGEQTLLPPPVPNLSGSIEGSAPFMGLSQSQSWTREEDVFVGGQNNHGSVQSNNFLGIPGDNNSGGLGGFTFGNIG